MPTSTTDRRAELRAALLTVTPAQQAATEVLAAGASHADAAEAAGVARETVTRWAGHHPGFRAALALYRSTLADEQAAKLRRIRDRALDVIDAQLADADLATALAVLRAVPDPGPTTTDTYVPTTAAAILDAEQGRLRHSLPPLPPPRDLNGRSDPLESLMALDYQLTADERAAVAVVERLADAAGITEDGDQ